MIFDITNIASYRRIISGSKTIQAKLFSNKNLTKIKKRMKNKLLAKTLHYAR